MMRRSRSSLAPRATSTRARTTGCPVRPFRSGVPAQGPAGLDPTSLADLERPAVGIVDADRLGRVLVTVKEGHGLLSQPRHLTQPDHHVGGPQTPPDQTLTPPTICTTIARMTMIGIRDLGRNPSEVVDDVTRTQRPTIVTRNGKPVAVMLPLNEDDLENYILAQAPEYVTSRREADADLVAGQTRALDEVLGELV